MTAAGFSEHCDRAEMKANPPRATTVAKHMKTGTIGFLVDRQMNAPRCKAWRY
ncbi:hypothetical protein [Reyranella sp.]|uniref:hypothetical protein n=1 Tax=Reyranella sp. TaxID=1929291 RepID=UPI003D0DBE99